MKSMKKWFSLMLVCFLMTVFGSCHSSCDSESRINTYIRAEILDADNVVIYSSSTELEKIPVLNLQDDYYLKLHIGPGSGSISYEYTTIAICGNEIFVQEIDDMVGGLYILKGLQECENIKLEIEALESISKNTTIKCSIYVSFL